ncbi:hypothetical protein [Nocardia ignorata]|uniref:Uncharacterized protein n=1 Tax=Nocardia ignorata TaxID=145285 RepID=A0A4R6NWD3_NOCIG|nr:hypothetical protein [Nocardia ignorata]TDP27618.1 hypothetical protein DFR75_1239 [Nocardia ignorata]
MLRSRLLARRRALREQAQPCVAQMSRARVFKNDAGVKAYRYLDDGIKTA